MPRLVRPPCLDQTTCSFTVSEWQVHFFDDELRTRYIEYVKENIYALVKPRSDSYYFDANTVLFLRLK